MDHAIGTALVTGGAKRIGRAIVEDLAAHGFAVAIHANRSLDEAQALASQIAADGGRAAVLAGDLTDMTAAGALIGAAGAALGPVSLLVNGASIFEDDSVLDFDWSDWDRHFAIHLKAPVLLARTMAEALPSGAELYFDNVGGPLFTQVLQHLNRGARVTICGLMAEYVDGGEHPGPDRLPDVLQAIMGRGLTIKAFSNQEHLDMRAPFLREVGALVREGRLKVPEHVSEGIENIPVAFSRLFTDAVVGFLTQR